MLKEGDWEGEPRLRMRPAPGDEVLASNLWPSMYLLYLESCLFFWVEAWLTFMTKYSGVYPPIPRNISMAHPRSNHLYKEFIFLRLAREEICPFPVMLRGRNDAFTRDGVY